MIKKIRYNSQILLFILLFISGELISQSNPADFASQNVELLGYTSIEEMSVSLINDVWGWTDSMDSTEYVIVGTNAGVCFSRLTKSGVPHYLGILPSHSSTSLWRDVKILGNYAYVVSEAPGHGLQIFDLTQLRLWNLVDGPVVWSESSHVSGFSTAHNIAVNETTNTIYILGSNVSTGGVLVFDAINPISPVLVGSYGESGYFHDAQIVSYYGPDPDWQGKTILLAANGVGLVVLDITIPSDIILISTSYYPNAHYAHQVWMNADFTFALLGDELDETSGVVNGTRTIIWDMANLDNPLLVGEYIANQLATDHNQYIVGELSYQSNYKAGLRIINLNQWSSATLTEIGYFDVFPANDNSGFSGSWSNYPFFSSGFIAVTSMYGGLYIIKNNILQVTVTNDSWCDLNSISFNVTVPSGFSTPYYLSIENLPSGVTSDGITSVPLLVDPGSTTLCTIYHSSSFTGTLDPLWVLETMSNRFQSKSSFQPNSPTTWYSDNDGDGFGDVGYSVLMCPGPNSSGSGFVNNALDCDDSRASSYPLASEICDFQDNDCNGLVDDNVSLLTWFPDSDSDGFGDVNGEIQACSPPSGYTSDSSDCNDNNASFYPGAPGTYQGYDNNCDGIFQAAEHHLCPGDFNFDGSVNVMDLLDILVGYGCVNLGCEVDLNEDGSVTVIDLLTFLVLVGFECIP